MVVNNICYLGMFLLGTQLCSVDRDPVKPLNVSLEEKWATDTLLRTPESVLYESGTGHIYVSNINAFNPETADGDGFISKLDKNGKIESLRWVVGLNDPKGLAAYKDKLYVADMRELVEIDLGSGKVIAKYPVPEAQFLNDLAVDHKGTVYISDMVADVVYQFKDGVVSVFLDKGIVKGPNGLLAENKKLYTTNGDLYETEYVSKATKTTPLGIVDADGLEKDKYNNFLISSWGGEVYYVLASGDKIKILDTQAQGVNAADIDYMEKENLLLVPTFFNNRIVAYKVKYQ
jgi:DNA-binding beta-propeller fold protein YncE